ncbi:Periplasmic aromatic aldehyde oxidoreductase [Amycolatopsis azurea DSM 43854]|uniref:Periplasmic aromatic aldehyde oxidoreductase n=1 Tax=Amycolatopsis azurea DSM 43854 TaxID=1238180 RepID=M2NMR2_9PSEU|nr:xanthine dehydrogenase family protein molybdopterin-binding subunit [Amycolatopsis azurea]EMD23414.1 Periplasmic aromatic aldehyde oxidoreductase [Amycolatopsis azurea DSM 43854]
MTVRSQLLGGMIMGLSMASHGNGVLDPRVGQTTDQDLAGYHIATSADIEDVRADWIDEHDPHFNPMESGEIGIVGTAAAIANVVHDATGARVRDPPITLDNPCPDCPGE